MYYQPLYRFNVGILSKATFQRLYLYVTITCMKILHWHVYLFEYTIWNIISLHLHGVPIYIYVWMTNKTLYWLSREPGTKSKPTLTQHWQDVPLQLKLPSSWTKFSNSASFIWGKSVNIKSENSLRIQNGPLESINMQVKIYNTPLFFFLYRQFIFSF